MQNRKATYSLLVILVMLGIFLISRWQEPAKKEVFDRTPEELVYTRHARCRMDCRMISRQEVEEVMQKGVINLGKSDPRDRPCPTYALQARTSDGDYLRVVFAQCENETRVVTCINLEKEFDCECP